MPTYLVLYKFTDEGAKDVKGTVERAREARQANLERGVTIHGLYWTQGRYDLVAVVEAADEATIMAGVLNVNGAGNARSETLRAFTESEMEAIIKKMYARGEPRRLSGPEVCRRT